MLEIIVVLAIFKKSSENQPAPHPTKKRLAFYIFWMSSFKPCTNDGALHVEFRKGILKFQSLEKTVIFTFFSKFSAKETNRPGVSILSTCHL